ncbi:hypothetical protein B2A_01987, partial [mine drainage metagenome]
GRAYRLTALDNRWLILFLPGSWRYESIETWYPKPSGTRARRRW